MASRVEQLHVDNLGYGTDTWQALGSHDWTYNKGMYDHIMFFVLVYSMINGPHTGMHALGR